MDPRNLSNNEKARLMLALFPKQKGFFTKDMEVILSTIIKQAKGLDIHPKKPFA